MIFLTIFLSFAIFWFLNKFKLLSTKALFILLMIDIALLLTCVINVFYNWNYFKQYTGEHTADYLLAHRIWDLTSYGLLSLTTIFICSIFAIARLK